MRELSNTFFSLLIGMLVSAVMSGTPATAYATEPVRASTRKPVGVVTDVIGISKVTHEGGAAGSERARTGTQIFETDIIESTPNGKVRISFSDDNVLNVLPETRVTIEELKADRGNTFRRTSLFLEAGKIRTKVKTSNGYDGKRNIFLVRTKAASANVRGTDFVTSLSTSNEKWTTEVRTLSGIVEFGGMGLEAPIKLEGGFAADFSVDAPKGDVTELQLKSYIRKGVLSQARKMIFEEVAVTDRDSEVARSQSQSPLGLRGPASAEPVCLSPAGQMGQCSFTCVGHRKGAKACLADKGAKCVRRLCNAGGKWADETVLSTRSSDQCDPKQIQVRACGDY